MTVPAAPHTPRTGATKTVRYVASEDFRDGPLIVTTPDTEIVLREDITLNFGTPATKESPFHLGFFGGIVVGASRVTVRLNGKTLRMHPNFRARQRFFALVALDVTPFPPGTMKFDTQPVAPTDVCILGPGTLGLTSHFGVHGNTLRGDTRILVSDVTFDKFEVGGISVSGASDVVVRRCTFGRAEPPTTTSDFLMLKDLAQTARETGAHAEAVELMNVAQAHHGRAVTSSDAVVRAITIMPDFHVQAIRDTFSKRIRRVAITDCTFDDLRAEPMECVGASLVEGDDAPLKDRHGNLIAHCDVIAGSVVSRMQAAFSPELPRAVRQKLMAGPSSDYYPVYGRDRRAHSLQGKGSLFARVDGCDDVTLRNLRGASVETVGAQGASVGFMLNGCERVSLTHVRVGGVHVRGAVTNALSDARPQSGLLLRRCTHVAVDDYRYDSDESCSSTFRMTHNAALRRCTMNAPATFLKCTHVTME